VPVVSPVAISAPSKGGGREQGGQD
jgi:hypothetical protein